MNNLSIEGWYKKSGEEQSTSVGFMEFYVSEPMHLRLEQAEEQLQKTHAAEVMVDADMATLDLKIPDACGPLSDCQFRVYLSEDQRGQFHLVGHLARDGSLIYSNAVMIDQLG